MSNDYVARISPTSRRNQWAGAEVPGKNFEKSTDPEREDLGWYVITPGEKKILEKKRDGDHAGAPFIFEIKRHKEVKAIAAQQRQRNSPGSAERPIGFQSESDNELDDLRIKGAQQEAKIGNLNRLLKLIANKLNVDPEDMAAALEEEEGDEEDDEEEEDDDTPPAVPAPERIGGRSATAGAPTGPGPSASPAQTPRPAAPPPSALKPAERGSKAKDDVAKASGKADSKPTDETKSDAKGDASSPA